MMFDTLIIGAGLAGVTLAHQLEKNKKSFCVISDNSQMASLVAGGVYNPVVLKRFTPIWKATSQTNLLFDFYSEIEYKIGQQILFPIPIFRRFASIEEQNQWFEAADNQALTNFLSPKVIFNKNPFVKAAFGFGQVCKTGRLDIKTYLEKSISRWKAENIFHAKSFSYEDLKIETQFIDYQGVTAKNIVFCEGTGISKNPFFNDIPLNPSKGEILTIYAPDLQLDAILKSDIVLFPIGNHHYKVGATYNWADLTDTITQQAENELLTKLKKLISCNFEVVSQEAAIRPTVIDRRPLLGNHSTYKNLWLMNGLGTRGVMNAPFLAEELYKAIFEGKEIDPEMNIRRKAISKVKNPN